MKRLARKWDNVEGGGGTHGFGIGAIDFTPMLTNAEFLELPNSHLKMDGRVRNCRIESWTRLSVNASAHTSEFIERGNVLFQVHGRLSAGATPSSTMMVCSPGIVAVESIPTNPFAFDTRRCKNRE
jgi:hypothetical protein